MCTFVIYKSEKIFFEDNFASSSKARSRVLIMKGWNSRRTSASKPETTLFLYNKKMYGN